ncbi:DsbA family oxidoreductase [Caulobacter soli]|uniref:DsbA family oxidoreductase n=1 Tax=Caulobacter soli TaxID=2708539 RepID=UPI0013EC39B6|nr:DsbA family oxidoreductase [Caulobacter soli]
MTIKIDLYSDFVCPWCLIGAKRLDNVLQEQFSQADIDLEHHPVFLDPDCPEGGVLIADILKARFGSFDPKTMFARPEAEARGVGLDLDMSKQPWMYPTAAGHTLIRLARPLGTQHALATALASAYFLEQRNIGDLDVLADIASAHGFTRQEARAAVSSPDQIAVTRQAAAASKAAGVKSVPHLVVNGVVTPVQDEAIVQALRLATR